MPEEVSFTAQQGKEALSFIHMHFYGRTTSQWHVGKRKRGCLLLTRDDYLWGRGVRGPVLRQLWRTFCPKSDVKDGASFLPERDCPSCRMAGNCPFANLRGCNGEGEFKDKPRLIITNLRFIDNVRKGRVALTSISDEYMSAVKGRIPTFIEYLSEGATFEFEAILMAEGVQFADALESAVKVSLKFHGWGGFCNEGFGRATITKVERNCFDAFNRKYVEPLAEKIENGRTLSFTIKPLLILEKDGNSLYRSIHEEGFLDKLCHCIDERYWQFYGEHIHIKSKVEKLGGMAKTVKFHAWSRKLGKPITFEGIGNQISLHLNSNLKHEEAKALAIAKYGVGRFKNQGFGSLLTEQYESLNKNSAMM